MRVYNAGKVKVQRLQGRAAVERRKRFLSANPLCVHCRERGYVTAAEEVDHIVPLHKGGADADANLQPLCKECHDRKTRKDLGWKASGACDARGLPLDPDHHWYRS